jgi:hypothetical protein
MNCTVLQYSSHIGSGAIPNMLHMRLSIAIEFLMWIREIGHYLNHRQLYHVPKGHLPEK